MSVCWARRRSLKVFSAVLLMVLVASCGGQATPSPQSVVPSHAPTRPSPSSVPSATPTAIATPEPSPSIDLAGRPFTILLLGADTGMRTDTVMVVGVDPMTDMVSMASIPRDTIDIPLPDGTIYRNAKINSLYAFAAAHPDRFPQGPGRTVADAVGLMLGVRIDHWALTTFTGFEGLVGAMGGVPVDLPRTIVDTFFMGGITFKAGRQTLSPKRALAYVRTRYDNDFRRQDRQQGFLLAALAHVLAHPELADALSTAAPAFLRSDLRPEQVRPLVMAMRGFDPTRAARVVMGPRVYEDAAACPCGYALAPKLDAMRQKAATLFPWASAS